MKANFKVPHATSNKPKKPHQGSRLMRDLQLCVYSQLVPEEICKAIVLLHIVQRGHVPRRIIHARAGIKSRSRAVRSLSTAGAAEQDWSWWRTSGLRQRSGGGRSGAGGGQAAGDRTGRRTDPDSTVELAEDEWTQAVQRSRSIDLELCTHRHVLSNMHLGGR